MRRNRFHPFAFVAAALLVAALAPTRASAQVPVPVEAQKSITAQELMGLLKFYSSDWFHGRQIMTPWYDMATDFLASQLAAEGIQPAGPNGSYFQDFDLVATKLTDDMALSLTGPGGTADGLKAGVDFSVTSTPASWAFTRSVPVVFAGFGIVDDEHGWNDYSGLDVKGKIVAVVDGYPGINTDSNPLGIEQGSRRGFGFSRGKGTTAQRMGAAGLITLPHPRVPDRTRIMTLEQMTNGRLRYSPEGMRPAADPFPEITLSPGASETLLGNGVLARTVERMESRGKPEKVNLRNASLTGHATVTEDRQKTRNVVAKIEGTDLKDQVVMLGAHADHIGERNGQINNGADDDGSGSVALLEIAEAFKNSPVRPRRTIIFGWWSGEEAGLFGSWFYSHNPIIPLDKTVALIQMDMIGRNEVVSADNGDGIPPETDAENANSFNMIGYSYSEDMKNLISRANQDIGLKINFRYDAGSENILKRSDHWNFLQQGVPIAFLFTGLHADYHRPTDTWDKINYPKMARISQLAFRAAWDLANTDKLPKLNPGVDLGGGGR